MTIEIKKERISVINDFIPEYPVCFAGIEEEIIRLESDFELERVRAILKQAEQLEKWYRELAIHKDFAVINKFIDLLNSISLNNKKASADLVDSLLLAVKIFNNFYENLKNVFLSIDPSAGHERDLSININDIQISEFNNLINFISDENKKESIENEPKVNFNKELVQQFIVEENEYANQMEEVLLKIESNSELQNDVELINILFRALHSMKGGSALILSTALQEVPNGNPVMVFRNISHSAEAVLQKIRDGKGVLSKDIIERLFSVVDGLKTLLQAISKNENTPEPIKELENIIRNLFVDKPAILPQKQEKSKSPSTVSTDESAARLKAFINVANQSMEAIDQCHKKIAGQNLFVDPKTIDKYLRSIKNLTTSSAYQGYNELIDLLQQSKDILLSIKEGKTTLDNMLFDLLIENFDKLKESVDEHSTGKQENKAAIKTNKSIESISNVQETHEKSAEPAAGKDLKLSEVSNTLRVKNEKIDKLMNLIGELIVTKNMFSHVSRKLLVDYDLPQIGREVKEIGAMISRIADGLQSTIMDVRMVPIRNVFQKFPRMVRDLSKATTKEINLILIGEETQLDKIIIEKINDPLIHLIRNSVDHGIESAEERKNAGKNPTGTITMKAESRGNIIYVEISDDGRGIDSEMVKMKALERGSITIEEAERLSPKETFNLLFLPGFSTAEKVTEISGRGVGLDIVKANLQEINGTMDIVSEVGKGTTFRLLLPLTLVISKGLIITVNKQDYVLPLESIQETIKIGAGRIHKFKQHYVTEIRDEVISLIPLYDLFDAPENKNSKSYMENIPRNSLLKVIILNINGQKAGLVVDDFSNEQEIVIKPLSFELAKVKGISGATIMGDGKIVLIINPTEILQLMYKKLLIV